MRAKLIQKVPEAWEIERLLGGINLRSTWGKRTYLMILFLCHTGLRIGEMTKLTVNDVAFEGRARAEVFLKPAITKLKRTRVVPFNPVAARCVEKLLEFNRKRGFSVEPEAPLFPWKTHGQLPPQRGGKRDTKAQGEGGSVG